MLAIVGKSGQFPLHTWLPDAMAGPTPVSALIHAATMVVAGVYLGARVYPVFFHGFSIGDGGINPMAAIGGITVLIGAALAFVQDDIKKVLAYSTISQLGYMVMALGVGAWTAAVFHLFTHAFFKADLFLGAGSVSHSGSHHSFDMKKDMGGLKKYMPQTYKTFVIGTLALAGIFPLAGFWSKDEILANAGHNDYKLFLVVGLIGAFMTAAYMTRCVYLTFHGEYRGGHEPHAVLARRRGRAQTPPTPRPRSITTSHVHAPHESNRLHHGPALGAVVLRGRSPGFLNFPHFAQVREVVPAPVPGRVRGDPHARAPGRVQPDPRDALGARSPARGIGIVWAYYLGKLPQGLSERNALAGAGKRFLVNKYYLDYLYEKIIVGGIKGPIAAGVYWFNQNVIDNVLNYTGKGAQALGRFTYDYVDQKGVDGLVNGIATLTGESGGEVRKIQTGRLAVLRTHARRRRRGLRRRPLDLHLGKGNRLDAFLVRLLGVDPRGLHPRQSARSSRCSSRVRKKKRSSGRRSHHARHARLHDRHRRQVRLRQDEHPAVQRRQELDRRHQQPLPRGRRRHLAADARAVVVHHGAVRHLFVEPLPRAAQPQGVPRADARSSRSA